MWMYLGLTAALFLGLYNLSKKHAVQGNEVFPVLLGTMTSGFLLILPLYVASLLYPNKALEFGFYIPLLPFKTHIFIAIKSMIMAASWLLAYQALKHLPITIVTPIRSGAHFLHF